MASRRWPIASSSAPVRSRSATCVLRCSTRWTSSGSEASPSRPTPSGLTTPPTRRRMTIGSTSSTPRGTSTSRTRCRGAWRRAKARSLLVDAAQGVEAQTLANAYLAIEEGLEIIPVVNKIDLPGRRPRSRGIRELAAVLGGSPDEVIRVSAKTGSGIDELLEAIIERLPPPSGDPARAAAGPRVRLVLRHLPGSCQLDPGRRRAASRIGDGVRFMATGTRRRHRRVRDPPTRRSKSSSHLGTGEVGYLITGVKEIDLIRVGDTVTHTAPTHRRGPARISGTEADGLLRAVSHRWRRLRASPRGPRQAAPQRLVACLPSGDQSRRSVSASAVGFLGLLHMEIVRERLEREYDLDLVATAPSVAYRANLASGRSGRRPQSSGSARCRLPCFDRRAVRQGDDHHPIRVHRHRDGPGPDSVAGKWAR